jgi:hypothetical protein
MERICKRTPVSRYCDWAFKWILQAWIFNTKPHWLQVNNKITEKSSWKELSFFLTRGGVQKSWVHGKCRAHLNMGENAISSAPGVTAWCQIRVIFCKKDGCRAQISNVGHKFLSEIHPWSSRPVSTLDVTNSATVEPFFRVKVWKYIFVVKHLKNSLRKIIIFISPRKFVHLKVCHIYKHTTSTSVTPKISSRKGPQVP